MYMHLHLFYSHIFDVFIVMLGGVVMAVMPAGDTRTRAYMYLFRDLRWTLWTEARRCSAELSPWPVSQVRPQMKIIEDERRKKDDKRKREKIKRQRNQITL